VHVVRWSDDGYQNLDCTLTSLGWLRCWEFECWAVPFDGVFGLLMNADSLGTGCREGFVGRPRREDIEMKESLTTFTSWVESLVLSKVKAIQGNRPRNVEVSSHRLRQLCLVNLHVQSMGRGSVGLHIHHNMGSPCCLVMIRLSLIIQRKYVAW